ncbi:MAG TPA: hypothetical protein VM100_06140 [Longimicrobiales bacterium]|nr:hypothetical protein [Longimicrobiales bacterium]
MSGDARLVAVERETARHMLASLAYRTQKALRDAPPSFADFNAGSDVRTPRELVRHMASVIGYARTYFIGGIYTPSALPTFEHEIERFHENVSDLAAHLKAGTALREITITQLLQGPITDALTHAGQLAMLRRMAGSPVASENFIFAEISADNLGSDQPRPAAPDSLMIGKVIHKLWRFSAWMRRR